MASFDIGWVDLTLFGVLVVSAIIGLVNGFVFEVMSLLGWVVAYVAAQVLSPELAPHLPIGGPGSVLNAGAAFACTFIAVLVVWGLAARVVRMLVRATPLTLIDRLLGVVFGLVRGAVVMLVVAAVVAMTPSARSPLWTEARATPWLNAALQELKPLLPQAVARHIAS